MDKHNKWVQLDNEKAMLLLHAQGAQLSMNSLINAPSTGQILEHHQIEKEHYFSCYIQGMKAYLKSSMQRFGQKILKRIDTELD